MTTLPTLAGPRITLRQLGAGDVDDLFAVFSVPEVVRWFGTPLMRERADAERLLADIDSCRERGDLYQWGIQHAGVVIGTTTLAHISRANRRAELGFALGRPHWGQGLAREAVGVLLDHAFGGMGLHRIEADTDPRNTRSMALLEAFGFQREGYARQRWFVDDEIQDAVLFGLLATDPRPADRH